MPIRLLALVGLCTLVAGCVPAQEHTPQTGTGTQAEEVHDDTQSNDEEIVIVERLLPTGVIEIGDRDAPVVLMMFTEHHCRYCKEFYSSHFPLLHRDYIDLGKVRLQIGILPLRKYTKSENAAISLLCAATQGKGIPMHELLFEVGANSRETQLSLARTLELDTKLFNECLDSPDTARTLERQKSLARSLGVNLVPTFFLNGEKHVGLLYYADLRGMLDEALR